MMELLQKALFNLPRVGAAGGGAGAPGDNAARANSATAAALDKLGLSHLYGAAGAVQAAAAAAAAASAQPHPPVPPPMGVNSFGVEAVSPNIVFDVASLVLYGTHAIPVRLKILLDRLFSVLGQDEVIQILKGYGWTLEDYQRGYILKDNRGAPLERWQMCSKEEEPLVLQQFLRFGETRPITQQLILQELSERSSEEQRARVQSEIKKLMERNSAAAAAAAAAAQAAAMRPQQTSPLASVNNNGHLQPPHKADRDSTSSPARSPHSKVSPSVSPSSSTMVSPKGVHGLSSPSSTTTPTSSVNGTAAMPPSSPLSAGSPLNKLQNMQPFDYRKAGADRKTPDSGHRGSIERPLPPSIPPMRLPPSSMAAAAAGLGMPLLPNVSVPHSLASYHNSITSMAKAQHEYQMSKASDENSHSALNLSSSRAPRAGDRNSGGSSVASRMPSNDRRSDNKVHGDDGIQQEMRKKLRDNIGMSYISPTTGKKRVQCNVCLKTFCDKGALKIHFSAVHLREMHKCSVEGCNMMFSSRRSRNRHSANPNPKLHTPHLRRKISPHDGRTHQGPFLPLAALSAAATNSKSFPMPPMGGMAGSGQQMAAAVHGGGPFGGMPPTMLSPENLQSFHKQQMDLQRLHEFKMNTLYGGHQAFDAKKHSADLLMKEECDTTREAKRLRLSDSDIEEKDDDGKSVDNQSTKDEASSGTQSAVGGSKRKSRNPTRITHLTQTQADNAEEEFSSDDDDEGFENPLDDNDDDDILDNDDDDDDDDQLGGAGSGPDRTSNKSPPPPSGNNDREAQDSPKEDHQKNGDSQSDSNEREDKEGQNNCVDAALVNNNNNNNYQAKKDDDDGMSEPGSPESSYLLNGDIPVDKENPKRCVECGKEFTNHFDVKHHYQNVHLKMMHKCTVEGCNAGFPSKRSRDRHSSNLNLHRKLLSTTSNDTVTASTAPTTTVPSQNGFASGYQNELLARLYAEQQNAFALHGAKEAFAGGQFGMVNSLATLGLQGLQGSSFFGQDLDAKAKELAAAVAAAQQQAIHSSPNKFRLLTEVGNHS